MSKFCISTLVYGDEFQRFIPIFTHSINRLWPDVEVKVFIMGELVDDFRDECLGDLTIYQNMFPDYPIRESTPNALRFLVPEEHFENNEYVFFTDVDMLFCATPRPLCEYYLENIWTDIHSGLRGPLKKPNRPEINGVGWKGKYRRICGGNFFCSKKWFELTRKQRKHYRSLLKSDYPDGDEGRPAAAYREYDEVMLHRINFRSGLESPKVKKQFVTGGKIDPIYRGIHIGDFKFPHRVKKMNMLPRHTTYYRKLRNSQEYQKYYELASRGKFVRDWMAELDKQAL